MTLQHWAFLFQRGEVGRRDFWAGFALCFCAVLRIIYS